MKLNCLIYTTNPFFLDELPRARSILMKTKGREDVQFTVKVIPTYPEVPTVLDADGHTRLQWEWFEREFLKGIDPKFNAVGFHFTSREKGWWKLSAEINGAYHRNSDNILDFWICADPGQKAEYYPFSEFLRLLIHEVQHGDVHWTSVDRKLVHHWDYRKKAIHKLPEKLSYIKYDRLLAKLKSLLSKPKPMILPIEQEFFDRVTQAFASPNPHYKSGLHPGADFAAPLGTDLVAPCDLDIIRRYTDHPTLGCAIFATFSLKGVRHYARFLHLSDAAAIGSYKQGDHLGRTGNTGDSTGPHLHIDVWNRPIDVSVIRRPEGVHKHLLDPVAFFKSNSS